MTIKPWHKLKQREQLTYLYIYRGHSKLSGPHDIPKQYIRSIEKMEEEKRKAARKELDETYYNYKERRQKK